MTTIDPSDLGDNACQGSVEDALYGGEHIFANQSWTDLPKDCTTGSDSVTMVSQDAFDANKQLNNVVDPSMTVDEEARILCAPGSDINSPRDIVSPSGELSSPFSAMESDGEGETGQDEENLSCTGEAVQRTNGMFGASTPLEYTTTPCASSSACDDDYELKGSRKKRRKTRRDLHPYLNGPALRFPKPANSEAWQHDPDTSPFSPPTSKQGTKGMNFNFGENSSRRSSSGVNTSLPQDAECYVENAKRSKTCEDAGDAELMIANVKCEVPATLDTPVNYTKTTTRRHQSHARNSAGTEDEQLLHQQFPRKKDNYELRILSQPESQHRARYLTEGSRGPVKDASQQGFPKVELIGYNGPAKLQVFVATDSGKIKPHGFYQACKVTGRNTSHCEEIEIEGTKVIEIPFKQDTSGMALSVDCVGILKLRNTDVEVRTGIRNQKRNQSVRLVFRVTLQIPTLLTLQIASSRISCTQPLGQPEISKKSIDKCSVEGGIEMFIIGKNFHRGTKVIYQDPEEPNGTQWSAEGEVDKETFHQSHMVVRVPPYHDQNIAKPVNVQLLVEFQSKKCEPHSFTYTPRPKEPEPLKDDTKKAPQENTGTSSIESALSLLDGPIDKKFLVALFSKLLTGGITGQGDSSSTNESHDTPKTESQAQQQAMPNSNVANQQDIINSTPLLQTILMATTQSQVKPLADGTNASNAEKTIPVANPNPNPSLSNVTNPFSLIHFTTPNTIPSFPQSTSQMNVIQPASFNPLSATIPPAKFTSLQTSARDDGGLYIGRVKTEIPDPSFVATTTIQTNPVIAPSTFQTQATFAPQVQNTLSSPILVNPVSFQPSQTSAPGELFSVVAASHSVTVTQSNPNSTFIKPTSCIAVNTGAQTQSTLNTVVNALPAQPMFITQPTPGSRPSLSFDIYEVPTSQQQQQQNTFLNTAQQSAGFKVDATSVPFHDMPSAVNLGQATQTQADMQTASNMMQLSSNQAQQAMAQQKNMQFQNSFGSKDSGSIAHVMIEKTLTDQKLPTALNTSQPTMNAPTQQDFSMTVHGEVQPMQIQPHLNNQGQQAYSTDTQQGTTLHHPPQQQAENHSNISHQQNDQDTQMHVDVDPFMEAQSSVKIPAQGNNISQNTDYSARSVTRITTVSDVQSMEGVAHVTAENQMMEGTMKDILISPQDPPRQQQPQVFQQISPHTETVPMSSNADKPEVFQIATNSVPMQTITPVVAVPVQNFPNIQQNGANFQVAQTTSPANVSFQPNVLPVSVPSQIFQSTHSGQLMGSLSNTKPMQTPGVTYVPPGNQMMDAPIKDILVSPQDPPRQQQPQVFQQISPHTETVSMSSNASKPELFQMATESVSMQTITPAFQNIPQPGSNFQVSQTTSPAAVSFQPNILPVSDPSQRFQSTTISNAKPMQTQPYHSSEANTKSQQMMSNGSTGQQGYQPMPVQSQQPNTQSTTLSVSMPAQVFQSPPLGQHAAPLSSSATMQAQPYQSADVTAKSPPLMASTGSPQQGYPLGSMQSQAMPPQATTMQLKSQPMTVQNHALPLQSQEMTVQSRSIPVQNQPNQGMPVQDQAAVMHNQAVQSPQSIPVQNQQPMPVQNQQPMPVQNQQHMPVQNQQSLPVQNHNLQRSTGNSARVQLASNFIYQGNNNNVALQPQQNTDSTQNAPITHSHAHRQNLTANGPLEPHSPNIYAMTKLLQSIDGSENLAAISGEDVQRHCQ